MIQSFSKHGIVIPTFNGHLKEVSDLLRSFNSMVYDAEDIEISLIVSRDEIETFRTLLSKYDRMKHVKIKSLHQIAMDNDGVDIGDEGLFLKRIGKFNFQAAKKLYGVLSSNSEWTLVLDSESLVIRPCCFADVFRSYEGQCPIFICDVPGPGYQQEIISNCASMLGLPESSTWFMDSQNWFYQRQQVNDLFDRLRKTNQRPLATLLESSGDIFPEVLFNYFVFSRTDQSTYTFHRSEDVLREFLGKDHYSQYIEKVSRLKTTPLEYLAWVIDETNYSGLMKLFNAFNLRLFKYDDRHGIESNTLLQRKFIEENSEILILPCLVSRTSFRIGPVLVPANFKESSTSQMLFVKMTRLLRKLFGNIS